MKNKGFSRLFIGLLLIAGLGYWLYRRGEFSSLQNCTLPDILILGILLTLSFIVNGIQFRYLLFRQNKLLLSWWDTVLLPFSMNLFSYLIPTNGGFIYSVYFLRKKYGVDISQGASIGIFIVYISLILSGLIMLVLPFFLHVQAWFLLFIAVLLILSPVLVWFAYRVFDSLKWRNRFFVRFKLLLNSMIIGSEKLLTDRKNLLVNTLITFIQILFEFLIYWYVTRMLEFHISPPLVLQAVLFLRISGIVRLFPGNLGLEELFFGGVFVASGLDISGGILIALLLRGGRFVLIIPLGILHVFWGSSRKIRIVDFRES